MNLLCLDIETDALPDDELLAIIPPFDPEAVKVGNMKDPNLIRAKIEESRASHFQDYKGNAALNPMTGRIIAVGLKLPGKPPLVLSGGEAAMLTATWRATQACLDCDGPKLAGWNITGFDLPWLIKRSFKHGIKPPGWLRDGRYWSRAIIDLLDVWKLGEFRKEEGKTVGNSLDNVAKFLGLPPKLGNGKDFAELLRKDQKAAGAYLIRDLEITEKIAGIIL